MRRPKPTTYTCQDEDTAETKDPPETKATAQEISVAVAAIEARYREV